MKLPTLFLFVGASLIAGAGLFQGEEPAEKVFKNIKTMKGTPAKDIVPSMRFMSASLKVNCEYCHVENDFASDEKHSKETAREMIELQKDINEKNFGGRTTITCNTCHNGAEHPARIPVVSPNTRRTIKRGKGEVAPILKRYAEASGAVTGVTLEGKVTEFGPDKVVALKMTLSETDQFRIELGPRTFGFDGKGGWVSQEGKVTDLTTEQLEEMRKFARSFRGEHAFDDFANLQYAGTDNLSGEDTVVLRSGTQGAPVSSDLYFSAKTGLLVRVASYLTTSLGTMPDVKDFSDYRKVGGTMVPFKISRPEGKGMVIEFTKAEPKQKLDPSLFARPKS